MKHNLNHKCQQISQKGRETIIYFTGCVCRDVMTLDVITDKEIIAVLTEKKDNVIEALEKEEEVDI